MDGSQPMQPQHHDSSALTLLLPGDQLLNEIGWLQRWVPTGAGHGGCNKRGISGEASPELRGHLANLWLPKCSSNSSCPGAHGFIQQRWQGGCGLRVRLGGGRTLIPGGQILMDLRSAARLPTAQGKWLQKPPGCDTAETTWHPTLHPTLPRHRQG